MQAGADVAAPEHDEPLFLRTVYVVKSRDGEDAEWSEETVSTLPGLPSAVGKHLNRSAGEKSTGEKLRDLDDDHS
jgi:hypothetical protein